MSGWYSQGFVQDGHPDPRVGLQVSVYSGYDLARTTLVNRHTHADRKRDGFRTAIYDKLCSAS